MSSRQFSLWCKAVALAPLLLLALNVPGEIMVRCHEDGLLRPAPCCAHECLPRDAGPAFKARDCCDREMTATQHPLFEAPRATADGEQISLAALAPSASATAVAWAPDPFGGSLLRHGPPRAGPSIIVVKHAFLI